MDFRRSTIVLIIGFLFLDILLFSIFWQMKREIKAPLNTNINVMEQMKNDGIVVNGGSTSVETLPIIQLTSENLEPQLNSLQNQVVSFEKGLISSQLKTPLLLTTELTSNPTQESFIELTSFVENGGVINGDQYIWVNYNSSAKKVVYAQQIDQVPIMDGTSQLIFTLNENNQVIGYEQTFAGIFEILGRNRSLITSQKAIEILYLAGRIPSKSTILTVQLSYYQSLWLKDLMIYSPAWYIEIRQSDGQVVNRRVDAIRGTVLTNDKIDPANGGSYGT